jgi:hypothetical protein
MALLVDGSISSIQSGVDQLPVGKKVFDQMSVDQLFVDQMFVGKKFVGQ